LRGASPMSVRLHRTFAVLVVAFPSRVAFAIIVGGRPQTDE
jgi:hypothetical protein